MAQKPTLPQLRRSIEAAIAHGKEHIAIQAGNRNPQVLETVAATAARIEAWEAVLWAMEGSNVFLDIWAGK